MSRVVAVTLYRRGASKSHYVERVFIRGYAGAIKAR